MEYKEPVASDLFFNNTVLLIDVRTRLNPNNQEIVVAETIEQGQSVAKLMRRALFQLHLKVQLDFTNVIPITPQFMKGLVGELVKTDSGNNLLMRIKFRGCGDSIKNMAASVVAYERAEYAIKSKASPQFR